MEVYNGLVAVEEVGILARVKKNNKRGRLMGRIGVLRCRGVGCNYEDSKYGWY